MYIKDYQALAIRTAKMFPTLEENLTHAVIGMITELGELATAIKRAFIYGQGYTPKILENILEEVGDFMWYVALAAHALDFELDVMLGEDQGCTVTEMQEGLVRHPDYEMATPVHRLRVIANYLVQFDGSQDMVHVGIMVLSLTALLHELGLSLDDACAQNIEKLKLRFPDAYSDEAAEARADKGGLPATLS